MHVSLCLFIYLLKVGIKIESDHDQKGYGHDFHDLENLGIFGMVKKFVSWRRDEIMVYLMMIRLHVGEIKKGELNWSCILPAFL